MIPGELIVITLFQSIVSKMGSPEGEGLIVKVPVFYPSFFSKETLSRLKSVRLHSDRPVTEETLQTK